MNFATYGPFELKDWSKAGIHSLFDLAIAEKEGLNKAIGIYIVCSRDKSGKLTPLYVGKTVDSFGKRFLGHYKAHKFAHLFPAKAAINIFLIARITGKSKFVQSTAKLKKNGLRSINHLEFALIGSCLAENNNLMNIQDAITHKSFHVPGYWNSESKNYDNAASELARMLGQQRT